MNITVKTLLKYGLSVAISTSIISTLHAQTASNQELPQAGYYRMKIGDAEIIALSDGTAQLNMEELLFNARPGEVKALLAKNFQSTMVTGSINAYLIRKNDQLILVDAGAGQLFGPTTGKLIRSLANAGYKPEQISAVLISHLHVDHVAGLMSGNQMVFPNATIYVSKAEVDFWLNAANSAKASGNDKFFFDAAKNSLTPYLDAGKVRQFTGDTKLIPGISLYSAEGHTPGHTGFLLESKGERILFWGDLVHAGAVQFQDPGVTIHFDIDASKATLQRKRIFQTAAQQKFWVAGSHIAFPGIGHLRGSNGHYTWVQANYSSITAN